MPAGNCTNAQETYTYNNRLQPWMIELGKPGGGSNTYASYCLVYNYFSTWTQPSSCPDPSTVPTTGSGNNGNVVGYWYNDSVNTSFNHTASYSYDNVNRLTQATATGNSTYSQIYSYTAGDGSNGQYGNMVCTTGCTPANWTLDPGSNHLTPLSSYTYDAAGDLTKDSSNPTAHTYQWDAEGRVSSVDNGATWGFTYNALGHRVQWAYPGGANQHMFDPNGGWLGVYGALDVLRWGDGAYAWYTGTETYFNHINKISSTTVLTKHDGTAAEDTLYYPWGQMPPWHLWGGGGANFAELPYQDPNTSTNIAMFRFHSPAVGRWLSPDPLAGDITNPQSLNRYAYVMNNPTTSVDPLGLGGGQCPPGTLNLTCNPQEAAQSNLGEMLTSVYGFGSGIADMDPFIALEVGETENLGTISRTYYAYDLQIVPTAGISDGIICLECDPSSSGWSWSATAYPQWALSWQFVGTVTTNTPANFAGTPIGYLPSSATAILSQVYRNTSGLTTGKFWAGWTVAAVAGSQVVTGFVGIKAGYEGLQGIAAAYPSQTATAIQFAQGFVNSGSVPSVPAMAGRVAKIIWNLLR